MPDHELKRAIVSDITQAARLSEIQGSGILRLTRRITDEQIYDLIRPIEGALGTELPPPPPPPPPPQVTKIELDTGPIGFSGGVPVGGTSHVTLFSDGTVNYTGHFHDSGAPSYDMAMVWVLSVGSGTTFTLAHTCRVHGTFEPGSRDCDWMVTTPNNQAVANVFGEFAAGNFSFQWRAGANVDITPLVDGAVKAVGAVGTIIALF